MKKSQELVLAQPSVSDAIERVNEEIKSLKHIAESSYLTSGKISTISGIIDVKTETNVEQLVTAFASVSTRVEAIEKAYEGLGIDSYPVVKIDGGSKEEWKKDISLRINVIKHKDRLEELNTIKKEWEELMDKEDRKALLTKKMQAKGLL